MVRAGAPARSIAASSTSAFITVASIPMASAVGRDSQASAASRAADQVAAADHDPDGDAELARRDEVVDDVLDRRGVDAEARSGRRTPRPIP